ncbi:hypothetical protein BDP27DRAFT_1336645 [Rhodocollybia butyracea]|uniref:Uncharacterized protein n=1 Tax=Rhodocollybia butyracea TaxID=206335 RepID=A0A9P5PGW3_9AGAR|nr:hypothetical protein BDP27DRAFT_1336645 [Rhodocollybia butyracea]
MLLLLDSVLTLRVFALYDRSRTIGVFFLLLLALRIASSVYSMYDHVLRYPEKIEFTSYCIPGVKFEDARNPVWVILSGEFIVQLAIITLTMKRTVWDFRQFSHLLFSVLNKDGLKVFSAIVVAMIAIVVVAMKKGKAYFFMFPLFIALISAAGCRTILNLQRLELEFQLASADGNSSERKKDIELTTIDSMDMTWDARTFPMIEDDTI